ncbi:MAG: methyltransferase domain-containing protein [Candidatus Saganbacteria bacterium]|nr:methyltransferase domain-containing protein [Candidatus Saganbacteria bacterium]
MNRFINLALSPFPVARGFAEIAGYSWRNRRAIRRDEAKSPTLQEQKVASAVHKAVAAGAAIADAISASNEANEFLSANGPRSMAAILHRHPSLGREPAQVEAIENWVSAKCWDDSYAKFGDPGNLASEYVVENYQRSSFEAFDGIIPSPPATKKIMEAGCGTAKVLLGWLERHRAAGVSGVGIDMSGKAVEVARRGAKLKGLGDETVRIEQGNIFELAEKHRESYDVVFNNGVIEHYRSGYDEVIRQMAAAVKPGGSVIVAVPSWHSFSGRMRFFSYGLNPRKFKADKRYIYAPFRYEVPQTIGELRTVMEAQGLRGFEFAGWSPLKHFRRGFPVWKNWENTGPKKIVTPKDKDALKAWGERSEEWLAKHVAPVFSSRSVKKALEEYFKGTSKDWFLALFGNSFIVRGLKP